MEKKIVGLKGEQAAAAFLKGKGYQILQANYRVAGAEVDLVARCGDLLCFVEVKTRKNCDHGAPEAFVSSAKQRRIIRAAKVFSARRPFRGLGVRFDVVSVLRDGERFACDHLEDAFQE